MIASYKNKFKGITTFGGCGNNRFFKKMLPSSNRLSHRPFTAEIWVQVPLGVPVLKYFSWSFCIAMSHLKKQHYVKGNW